MNHNPCGHGKNSSIQEGELQSPWQLFSFSGSLFSFLFSAAASGDAEGAIALYGSWKLHLDIENNNPLLQ